MVLSKIVEVLGLTVVPTIGDEVRVCDVGLGDGDGRGRVGISNVSPSNTLSNEYGPHSDSPSRLMVLALTRRR